MKNNLSTLAIVKAISSFILEHEASHTTPTTVHITQEQKDDIKKEFPYLISGDIYTERTHKLRILLNDSSVKAVGVGFTYFTDYPEEYK